MRRLLVTAGLLALMLILIAALVLMRPEVFSPVVQAEEGRPERVMVIAAEKVVNGERVAGEVRVQFEDPDSLPEASPGAMGLYLGRNGDRITVGQGSIEVEVEVEVVNDEEPIQRVRASHSGGEALIRVTEATIYLADTTEMPAIRDSDIAAGKLVVQRVLEPGDLGELIEPMMIRAWGVEQGGELVADLLLYESIH